MKTYTVTGYKMVKNPDTWATERTGELMTVSILCAKNSPEMIERKIVLETGIKSDFDVIEMIEGEVAIKMGFDWFEAVTLVESGSDYLIGTL